MANGGDISDQGYDIRPGREWLVDGWGEEVVLNKAKREQNSAAFQAPP